MNLWNTIRIVTRTWHRTPALAAVIVCTLALGIGVTTAAFTIAHSILVRQLPFPDADRLAWITTFDTRSSNGGAAVIGSNRLPQFADWQQHLTSVDRIGAWSGDLPDVFTVTGAGTPERVSGLRVTHQLLSMFGATPQHGRLFRNEDDDPGASPTVVLSQGYWQRRFNGRPDIIGRSITIENRPHTIVGIVSSELGLSGSIFAGAPVDVFLPLTIDGNEDIGGFMAVVGRLRPGATGEQLRAELATRQTALSVGKWSWMTVLGQRVAPLPELLTREARLPVLLLLAGSGSVLLMACANLVNLLLVRAAGRVRELQVRLALGASTARLFGEMAVESAVLVAASGILGVGLAAGLMEALPRASWISIARVGDVHLGGAALAFAVALGALITCVFSATTLLQLRRRDMMDGLRSRAGITTDRRAVYVQRMALVTQAAVVVVLVVTGGLLLRSLAQLLEVDPGFDPDGVMAIRVDPAGRLEGPARLPFFNRVIESVAAVPGVESAALTIHVPMGDRPSMGWDAIPEGQPFNPVTDSAAGRIVSPGYFTTVGIQIAAGRDFDANDVRPRPMVMAVNETFARSIRAAGGTPLGARFQVLGNLRQVVAVVADVKHRSLDGDPGREVYIPIGQAPGFFQSYDLVVRAADPIAQVPAVRSAIWAVDRDQALGTPVPLGEYIGRTLRARRLLTSVIGVFAAATLLLAVLGVYGVVGFRLTQRMKEIAIRVALGAPAWRVATVVVSDTLTFVALGLAAGILLALPAASVLRGYLFGVEPSDGITLVAACATVLVAALLAAYLPARRAPRMDPIAALRAE